MTSRRAEVPPLSGRASPELLNDRYRLDGVVGSGGMGAVHRATDLRLGRAVAVKVLRGGSTSDVTSRARMRSEANLAASIHHRGVAQVYDFGEDADRHGPTFIVMELVEGRTLAQLLREEGPMAPDQVMSVLVQVAEGLQAAHDVGVIHRDLKPANIMLTPAGRTVLVDFGIARSASSEPLTETGVLVGTAEYMSPEQASGRAATPSSDLYSLGVVAFHCLTGTSPFRRETTIGTAMAHLNDELPTLPGGVPASVVDLVTSLTAKNPSQRPSSAAVVAAEAARIGAPETVSLPPTFELPVVRDVEAPRPSAPGASSRIASIRSRRRPVAFAGGGIAIAVLAVLGAQGLGRDEPVVVPDVVGMDVREATGDIRDAGMAVTTSVVDRVGRPAGQVVEQSLTGRQDGGEDVTVALQVASGSVTVSADEIIGIPYAEAAARLEAIGLQVVREDVARPTAVGDVVAVDRSGRVPDGSNVTLSVAVAPVPSTSPPTSAGPSGGGSGKATSPGSDAGRTNGNGKGKGKNK